MKSRLLTGLLALFGFTMAGCVGMGNVEYGSPYVEFEVKGTVTAADGGAAIEGIRVSVTTDDDEQPRDLATPVLTDADGNYVISEAYWSADYTSVRVTARDVDGADNGGLFITGKATFEMTNSDYVGNVTKTVNFELEKVE